MSFKDLLFADVEKFIEENDDFTKKDLLAVVSNCYDANKKNSGKKLKLKKTKDDEDEKQTKKTSKKIKLDNPEKEKKPLTDYQSFVKTTLKTLKEREDAKEEGEVKMKQKDLMKEVGELWKLEKVKKDNL